MIGVVAGTFVIHEGAEHGAAVVQVVPIDGDVPTGRRVIRAGERKQAAQLAFLPGKQVVKVVRRVVRPHHGVINHRSGDGKPGHKVLVLRRARRQINLRGWWSALRSGRFACRHRSWCSTRSWTGCGESSLA